MDPATQLAGEETDGLPQEAKDKLSTIPEQVRREVRKAHHDLGHPSKTALMRLARLAKKSPDHLYYIKQWQCRNALCAFRGKPHRLLRERVLLNARSSLVDWLDLL